MLSADPDSAHGLSASAIQLVDDWSEHLGGDPALVASELRTKLARARTSHRPEKYRLDVRESESPSVVEIVRSTERRLSPKGITTPVIVVGLDFVGCNVLAPSGPTNGLQDAIDMAKTDSNGTGLTEIRVASSGYYVGRTYDVEGQSVRIQGGYEHCDSASPSGMTTLDAAGETDTVFEISGTTMGDPYRVSLLQLDIRGSAGDSEGGGIEIDGDNQVFLVDTFVSSNEATAGGGIHIDGGGASGIYRTFLRLDGTSTVSANTATSDGGGIYCESAGLVSIGPDSAVANNDADNGAGLYLDGCGGGSSAGGTLSGIFGNQAQTDGGGIYVREGGAVHFSLDHPSGVFSGPPPLVHGNEAGDDGGGIYIEGSLLSSVVATNARIANNRAMNGSGGGVLVTGPGASFEMNRDAGRACHTVDRCSTLTDNHASFFGGGLSVQNGGAAEIYQTYVEDNSAGNGGSAVDVFGTDSTLMAESSVFADNHAAPSVLNVENGARADFHFVTVTENDDQTAAFYTEGDSTTELYVRSSIIWENEGDSFFVTSAPSDTTVLDCSIVYDDPFALGVDIASISMVDPQFVDPLAGDYHLAEASRAVDFCDAAVITPSVRDIDHQLRGVDAPTSDHIGVYDIGADENPFPIFSDGFESGDTSAWSSTVPST